jgi:S-adenosylmethionine:tRNA ribosyltransferase-isomerase
VNVSDFDYHLPQESIAQTPVEPRDASRLMHIRRSDGQVSHHIFRDLPGFLRAGDVLVMNDTRVIPARLFGKKTATGGGAELLLLSKADETTWHALVGGRGLSAGAQISLDCGVTATVTQALHESERIVRFSEPIEPYLNDYGQMPLPPYIRAPLIDRERYQTVYSRHEGSAAAPTAGLHFTPELLASLRNTGVKFAWCTLHIGLGTFQPVKVERIADHVMHYERALLSAEDARIINEAKLAGGRIIAVGTTSARTLETAGILSEGGTPDTAYQTAEACPWRPVVAFEGDTNLFIYPGYRWRVLDGIITNFHLPKSTLLMMISALVGRKTLLGAYETAVREGYRFFSFGDAMFIA